MLNAERVILMTRLASYEAGEGKQNVAIGKYFRSDYIRMQTIKSVVYASITFFIVAAMVILMDLEAFLGDIYQMDMLEYAKGDKMQVFCNSMVVRLQVTESIKYHGETFYGIVHSGCSEDYDFFV